MVNTPTPKAATLLTSKDVQIAGLMSGYSITGLVVPAKTTTNVAVSYASTEHLLASGSQTFTVSGSAATDAQKAQIAAAETAISKVANVAFTASTSTILGAGGADINLFDVTSSGKWSQDWIKHDATVTGGYVSDKLINSHIGIYAGFSVDGSMAVADAIGLLDSGLGMVYGGFSTTTNAGGSGSRDGSMMAAVPRGVVDSNHTDVGLMFYDILALQAMYGASTVVGAGSHTLIGGAATAETIYDTVVGGATMTAGNAASTVTGASDRIDMTPNTTVTGAVHYTKIDNQFYFNGPNTTWKSVTIVDSTVSGAIHNYTIYGNDLNDTIIAGAGNNTIIGGKGADSIVSGAGDDTITMGTSVVGAGADNINAGGGANVITVWGKAAATITTGAGNDSITVHDGAATINGGDGNNTITAGLGAVSITGGAGNDTITVTDGKGVIIGGDGTNTITMGKGAYTVTTGSGGDHITAGTSLVGAGADTVNAGDGANVITIWGKAAATITTGAGADSITVGDGAATITSGAGNDTIIAGAGKNTITAGDGDDTITVGAGVNSISGGAGNDHISLGAGKGNVVTGGEGNDTITCTTTIGGGKSTDKFTGGAGDDTMTGGAADVTFNITASSGNDTITDFAHVTTKGAAHLDVINFSGVTGMDTIAHVLAATHDVNGVAVITISTVSGSEASITLTGVTTAQLTAMTGEFTFLA